MENNAHNEFLNNKLIDWKKTTGEILFAQAVQLARKGRYIEAERALNLLSTYSTSPARVYLLLGKIYAQQKRYDEAIIQWQRVLELEPKNCDVEAAIICAKRELKQKTP